MQEDASKSGLKLLIKEMYKAEAKSFEKGDGAKPKPLPKSIAKEDKEDKEPNKTKSPKITEDMKDIVKGFFQQVKKKAPPKEGKLYVGSAVKKNKEKPVVKRRRKSKEA